jgi:hypothetical protein
MESYKFIEEGLESIGSERMQAKLYSSFVIRKPLIRVLHSTLPAELKILDSEETEQTIFIGSSDR